MSSTSSTEAAPPPDAPASTAPRSWVRSPRALRLACGVALLTAWAAFLRFGLGGRLGLSTVVLFLTGVALLWSMLWLYRSFVALAVDPPGTLATRHGGAARRELLRDKHSLLKAIKELEFDHAMGKLSNADYQELVTRYRQSAVAVLRRLDEGAVTYRTLIEREVRRRLAATATGSAAGASARVCPVCAHKNDDDAAFCKSCGTRLASVAP